MTTPFVWLSAAQQLQAQAQPYALVTVLRVLPPTSAKVGDKAVVTADGVIRGWIGGGCAQPAVIKTVRRALKDGQPRTIRITPSGDLDERQLGDVLEFGMSCQSGGTLELFVEPMLPQHPLTVFGDSPVARALADLAPRVGFSVRLVAHGAQAADYPSADQVLATDAAQAVLDQLGLGGWVVVATQGRRDLLALKAALAMQARGLWFVASHRKASVMKDSLIASGEDADAVQAIIAPAGTPIGAQTPEEIALSVLGAVVAARRQNTPRSGIVQAPTPARLSASVPEAGAEQPMSADTKAQEGA